MKVCLIAAMDKNKVIGDGDKIPWRLKSDMQHFKSFTLHKPVIMGRKTWETFKGRPLPNRTNIVITRQQGYEVPEGVVVVNSLTDAFYVANMTKGAFQPTNDTAIIIGGSEIYREALPYVSTMCITHVDAQVKGDVIFPEYNEKEWSFIPGASGHYNADEFNEYQFDVFVYQRCRPARMIPL